MKWGQGSCCGGECLLCVVCFVPSALCCLLLCRLLCKVSSALCCRRRRRTVQYCTIVLLYCCIVCVIMICCCISLLCIFMWLCCCCWCCWYRAAAGVVVVDRSCPYHPVLLYVCSRVGLASPLATWSTSSSPTLFSSLRGTAQRVAVGLSEQTGRRDVQRVVVVPLTPYFGLLLCCYLD